MDTTLNVTFCVTAMFAVLIKKRTSIKCEYVVSKLVYLMNFFLFECMYIVLRIKFILCTSIVLSSKVSLGVETYCTALYIKWWWNWMYYFIQSTADRHVKRFENKYQYSYRSLSTYIGRMIFNFKHVEQSTYRIYWRTVT